MKRRNKYSHNGCKNCKASSVKCDETIPVCSNCKRRGIRCEYKSNVFVYQPNQVNKGKRTPFKNVPTERESTHKQMEEMSMSLSLAQSSLVQSPLAQSSLVQSLISSPVILPTPPINSIGIIDEVINQIRHDFNSRNSKPTTHIEPPDLECNKINQMYDNENLLKVPELVNYWIPFDQQRYLQLEEKFNGKTASKTHYHENDPEVLEYLFHILTETTLAYNFVLAPDNCHNCVAEWFLYFSQKYSIVALTVNSISSLCLDVKRQGNRWGCILQRCMSATLKNISRRVGNCESFPEMVCYLICIMFLFSERSASRLNTWRLHLKGAFAIVEKCDSLFAELSQSGENMDYEVMMATKMYAWTKNWFVSSETTACLSAPNGGAIEDITLARKYLSYDLIIPGCGYKENPRNNDSCLGGLNLLKGYSQSLTPVLVDIIEYIMKYKNTEGVSLSGSEGILHSVTVHESQLELGQYLLDRILQVENERFDFSTINDYNKRATMKACNICHCSALKIFIYSVILGKSIYGPDVQYYVQIIEEQLATINNIAIHGLCIHWPLFVAALCAPKGTQRNNLLSAIQTMSDNGTYVARNTAERLQRCWKVIEFGGVINEKDYDYITT